MFQKGGVGNSSLTCCCGCYEVFGLCVALVAYDYLVNAYGWAHLASKPTFACPLSMSWCSTRDIQFFKSFECRQNNNQKKMGFLKTKERIHNRRVMDRWTFLSLTSLNRQLTVACLDNSTVDYLHLTCDYYYHHPSVSEEKRFIYLTFRIQKLHQRQSVACATKQLLVAEVE